MNALPTRGLAARQQIIATATQFGVTPDVAAQAADNLCSGRALLLVVSGKLGSGKDTIAPRLMAHLGAHDAQLFAFGTVLKLELNRAIAVMRTWHNATRPAALTDRLRWHVARLVADELDVPVEQARAYFTSALLDQVLADRSLTAFSRTPVIRRALQWHGSEVRRTQNPNYLVTATLANVFEVLAAGTSVYFTGGRFPDEVSIPQTVGGFAVRLDVSPEVQTARLISRDGGVESAAALNHPGELALDDFDGFDVRINNDGAITEAIELLAKGLDTASAHPVAA